MTHLVFLAMWLAKQPVVVRGQVLQTSGATLAAFGHVTWLSFLDLHGEAVLSVSADAGVRCLEGKELIGEDDPRLPACVVRQLKVSAKGVYESSYPVLKGADRASRSRGTNP